MLLLGFFLCFTSHFQSRWKCPPPLSFCIGCVKRESWRFISTASARLTRVNGPASPVFPIGWRAATGPAPRVIGPRSTGPFRPDARNCAVLSFSLSPRGDDDDNEIYRYSIVFIRILNRHLEEPGATGGNLCGIFSFHSASQTICNCTLIDRFITE